MTKLRSRRLSLRVAVAGVGCAGLLLCLPAIASAATTIGADMTHNSPNHSRPCSGDPANPPVPACELAQLSEGGVEQVAPADGVVTRWRVDGASGRMALRVITPNGGGEYLFDSTSATEVPADTGVNTFNTRLPIQAGDYIGVELQSGTATLGIDLTGEAPTGTTAAAWEEPVANGDILAPDDVADQARAYVNADIEPDADHDGFGDETQDQCPTNASTQGPCPAPPAPAPDKTSPVVSASGKSAHLSRKGTISFFLTSNEVSSGSVTGSIGLPKLAKVVRFARRSVSLAANVKTKVTLKLSKKNAAAVRKALKKHKRVTAKITASLKDAAGNATTKKLSVRITR